MVADGGSGELESLPYEYASADATPLLVMAVDDYLKISGDAAFVESIWPALERAWNFETTHDSDGDGIYDNSRERAGWSRGFRGCRIRRFIWPHWMSRRAWHLPNLARATGHGDLADQAQQRAARIAKTIEAEYYLPDSAGYAFSWSGKDGPDKTATIFPSVAWWDGTYRLEHVDPMMRNWAGSEFSTDWGTRIVSDQTSFYDPISYHQGTVWPLFTGWVSVAEYRAGHVCPPMHT